jgi:hypothetical protein
MVYTPAHNGALVLINLQVPKTYNTNQPQYTPRTKTMKKTILALVASIVVHAQAAQVDFGMTLGVVNNNGSLLQNAGLFQLGTFSGYNDGTGAAYFTGKDYATLVAAFSSFPLLDGNGKTDNMGQFYFSLDTGTTPANTRLFAWAYSADTASSSANWAIASGTIGDTGDYGSQWLAVAPSDTTVNTIELGINSNVLYAKSSPLTNFGPNTEYDPSGVNLNLVPEPSTYALLGLAGLALGGYAARRRRRA